VKGFSQHSRARLLQPNWSVKFGANHGVIVGNGRLFAVLAGANAVACAVDVTNGGVTILSPMPAVPTAKPADLFDLGYGTYDKGRLFFNWFDQMIMIDAETGERRSYQGPLNATLIKSPLVLDNNAFCLWRFKDHTAQVTRWNLSDVSSGQSPILAGEPYHRMQGVCSRLFIALRAEQRELPGRLYRLNQHSLQVEAECPMPLVTNEQGFLVTEDLVYIPYEAPIRVKPEGPYHGDAKFGWRDGGARATNFLSSYDPEHLEPVRSWRLSSPCMYLSELPETAGVVITLRKIVYETSVEVLLPTHPQLMEIGEWPGEATQPPVFSGNKVYWVANVGRLSSLESLMSLDSLKYEAPPPRTYDTEIHIADFVEREHRVLGLNLGNGDTHLTATDGRVVIATGRDSIRCRCTVGSCGACRQHWVISRRFRSA
jgi:hypothetical protein